MTVTDPGERGKGILLRRDAVSVATLTLNRPAQYNALSTELLVELQTALENIAKDPTVRVVILAAAGPAFCAGHDLKELRGMRACREDGRALFARCSRLMMNLQRLPQPVIARVQGVATAAGCQLVAACDLAVASTSARFAVSGINVGLFCSTPGVALSRNIPRKRAFEMLVTGELIDAQAAADYGLVNRVAEPEELDETIESLARLIISKPRAAVASGKALFYRQIELDQASAYDEACVVISSDLTGGDAAEGIEAFLEKRAARWQTQDGSSDG